MLPIEAKQELLGRTLDLTTVQAESVQQQNNGALKRVIKKITRNRRVKLTSFWFYQKQDSHWDCKRQLHVISCAEPAAVSTKIFLENRIGLHVTHL